MYMAQTNQSRIVVYLLLAVACIGFLIWVAVTTSRDDRTISSTGNSAEESKKAKAGEQDVQIEIVADNLVVPWEIAFLPNGDMLVTERPGRLQLFSDQQHTFIIDDVVQFGEGGLHGLAVHPDFNKNRLVYAYLTVREAGDIKNRIERYRLNEDATLTNKEVIFNGIPGERFHNGGRIAFGPDGYLYVTTGDAQESSLAQDRNSLAGKVLRLNDSGGIPADNPFGSAVYSYGHRNPQGLAWDDQGQLWITEHGPVAHDEINRVEKGGNYGWPEITGDASKEGMQRPAAHSGNQTWAPAGVAILNNKIYFAGLRGRALFSGDLMNDSITISQHFENEYGRIRAVTVHDGYLYISTSNRDGRGTPKENDDLIIRISPSLIGQ